MPIDFPTNPTSGQTYSYNSITWEYNGVAWDKQGGGGSVGPQGNTGATGPQGNTGATGPVGDYVISLRGLTGAVGITNGSGIGLSVSGNTLTVSNTGVLSINGGTGAITNVARTNVDNAFTALQSFSSGISASGATFGNVVSIGRIISGGTSGIIIEPGSGILGISGGVSGGYGLNANSFGLTSGFDIIPASWDSITAPMGAPGTVANRLYLVAISIPSRCTIKTFATQQGTSSGGNTGNIFLGLYNTNIHGLPQNLVAQSPSQALTTTNFAIIRASNINYTANPGNYWLAICFSAGGLSGGIGRPGTPMKYITATSSSPIAQAMNWGLYVTQSGFTLSTSLSGATFTAITTNTNFPGIFYTAEGL